MSRYIEEYVMYHHHIIPSQNQKYFKYNNITILISTQDDTQVLTEEKYNIDSLQHESTK